MSATHLHKILERELWIFGEDLHLAVRGQEHDRARHLIVELKASDITLGRKELDQVEDYTNVIVGHQRFATGGSSRRPRF